jgi:ABC-type Zn2+ transport system substrate-binding protein/surface adhesin
MKKFLPVFLVAWLTVFSLPNAVYAADNTSSEQTTVSSDASDNLTLALLEEGHGEDHGEHDHASHGDDHAHHAPHLDGSSVNLLWIVPFVGILLSIAIFPLVAPHVWFTLQSLYRLLFYFYHFLQ